MIQVFKDNERSWTAPSSVANQVYLRHHAQDRSMCDLPARILLIPKRSQSKISHTNPILLSLKGYFALGRKIQIYHQRYL
jgi:hypothetical protein